jgi:hypothetical protein
MTERQPALRPTDPATLVVAGLATAGVAWLLISNLYQDLPRMIWPPVVVIAGIAGLQAVIARNLWVRIHRPAGPGRVLSGGGRSPGGEPVDPLAVARYAVLAKASSLAGAIFTGWYAGLLPWLWFEAGRLPDAANDLPPTVGGLLASAALVAVALWLERACRVPEPPGEAEDRATGRTGEAPGTGRDRPESGNGSGEDR